MPYDLRMMEVELRPKQFWLRMAKDLEGLL